ncbi:structural maintenance of chromosomes 5 [Haemaphysalis longicornis]
MTPQAASKMQYATGAIVRIKLENFMTYTFVEVQPGPNLNVIVGTNGSGKSSLVCAICLGLCGTPSTVGRASHVSHYIKHGATSALVEIELFNAEGSNHVIQRTITPGKSTWTLNRSLVPQKQVEALVSSLNIQVNNLCQFLPQDRVADFVRMSRQELLEGTERAVGTSDLFQLHSKLKELQAQRCSLERSLSSQQSRLEQACQKMSNLDAEVKKFQEHKDIQHRIERMRQKLAWLSYDESRKAYLKEKEQLRAEELKMKKEEKTLAEHKEKKEGVRKRMAAINVVDKKLKEEAGAATKKVETSLQKINELTEKARSHKRNLHRRIEEEGGRSESIQKYKDDIAGIERDTAQSSFEAVEAKIKKVQEEIQKCNQAIASLNQDKSGAENFIREKQAESSAVVQEIKRVKSQSEQRMELLRRRSRDAYEATIWLQQNQDRFRGKIHAPIMIEVDVLQPADAKYVESQIPARDLLLFVAEYTEDLNAFLAVVRDTRNLRINGAVAPPESLDSFQPRRPLSDIRQYGFRGYMQSLFTAPDAVMRYLCKRFRVHDVPVGTARTEECLQQVRQLDIRRFYTRDNLYNVTGSRYDPSRTITMSSELSDPKLLILSVDLSSLDKLEEQKQMLADEISSRLVELKKLFSEERVLQQQLEEHRTTKKGFIGELSHLKQLKMVLEQKRATLQRLESEALNVEEELKKAAKQQEELCTAKIDEIDSYVVKLKAAYEKHERCVDHSLDILEILSEEKVVEEDFNKFHTTFKALEVAVQEKRARLLESKREAQKKLREAQEATKCPSSVYTIPPEIAKEFDGLPATADEIVQKIHMEEVRLKCMHPVDATVEQEYQQHKRDAGQLEKEVKGSEVQMAETETEIEETRGRWLPQIEHLLQRINQGFGRFFSSLGCAGDVSLYVGERKHEYDKYGVNIRVRFRDDEPLAELSAAHQSGGERSVATVLYMMALQELTSVPFRCVDEINQGMDSQNERRVFEMIMNTARKNSAQYFLLTPKLLADLPYADNVTMIFISKCAEYTPDWDPKSLAGHCVGYRALLGS